ncbi:hypothetical protein AAZX31_16G055000 [Glycine max]|uniref:Uncharacterized protein n=2 Tax=Glycine subgen. Soja TaxID=1462606 RepID=A0A0R0FM26_SOYBN|nr:hypothetical protein JHK85_045119 [Glycine max]KAH1150162.1 hypothetical protein GYH30_044279 [Glycine max]KHN10815.1 hypothetical protein glysoja_027428 [Glycine soja]KRH06974.1 hypothetical protein GLYMA_16G058600v4 [Glycine max]RZB59782.1 hypothetical protein D0Y65_042826 [Glycine soja]
MVHLLETQQSKEEDHFSDIMLWLKQNKAKRSICETVCAVGKITWSILKLQDAPPAFKEHVILMIGS